MESRNIAIDDLVKLALLHYQSSILEVGYFSLCFIDESLEVDIVVVFLAVHSSLRVKLDIDRAIFLSQNCRCGLTLLVRSIVHSNQKSEILSISLLGKGEREGGRAISVAYRFLLSFFRVVSNHNCVVVKHAVLSNGGAIIVGDLHGAGD